MDFNINDFLEHINELGDYTSKAKSSIVKTLFQNKSSLQKELNILKLTNNQTVIVNKIINNNNKTYLIDILKNHKHIFTNDKSDDFLVDLLLISSYLNVYPYNQDANFQKNVYKKILNYGYDNKEFINNIATCLNNYEPIVVINYFLKIKNIHKLNNHINIQNFFKNEKNKLDIVSKSIIGGILLGSSATTFGMASIPIIIVSGVSAVKKLPFKMALPIFKGIVKLIGTGAGIYGFNKIYKSSNKNYKDLTEGVGKNYVNFISIKDLDKAPKNEIFKNKIANDIINSIIYDDYNISKDDLDYNIKIIKNLFLNNKYNEAFLISKFKNVNIKHYISKNNLNIEESILLLNIDRLLTINNTFINNSKIENFTKDKVGATIYNYLNNNNVLLKDKEIFALILDLATDESYLLKDKILKFLLEESIANNKLNISNLSKLLFDDKISIISKRHENISEDLLGFTKLALNKTTKYSMEFINENNTNMIKQYGEEISTNIVKFNENKIKNIIKNKIKF